MTWCSLYRKLGGPQDQSGHVWKILLPLGFSPQTIQLVASCHTYYVVTAHLHSTVAVTFMQLLKKVKFNSKDILPYYFHINPLKPELYPICYLLALLAHHFLHVSRIRVKSLTLRSLTLYIY